MVSPIGENDPFLQDDTYRDYLLGDPNLPERVRASIHVGAAIRPNPYQRAFVCLAVHCAPLEFWRAVDDVFSDQMVTGFDDPDGGRGYTLVWLLLDTLGRHGEGCPVKSVGQQETDRKQVLAASRALRQALDDATGHELVSKPARTGGEHKTALFSRRRSFLPTTVADVLGYAEQVLTKRDKRYAVRLDCPTEPLPFDEDLGPPSAERDRTLQDVLVQFERAVSKWEVRRPISPQAPSPQRALALELVEWFGFLGVKRRRLCINTAGAVLRGFRPDMPLVKDPLR